MKKVLILILILVFMLISISTFGQENEILKLKEKIIEIQNRGELGFKNFTLCSNIISFASFVPLPEPVIKKDGELLVYFEPLNVFTSKKNGLYEIWYTQDMSVLTAEGKVIYEKEDALSFHYTTKSPVMDLFATNTITLTGLASGKYKYKATLKDKLRNKTAAKIVDFEVR